MDGSRRAGGLRCRVGSFFNSRFSGRLPLRTRLAAQNGEPTVRLNPQVARELATRLTILIAPEPSIPIIFTNESHLQIPPSQDTNTVAR